MNHDSRQEIRYRLLKLLAEEPQIRQRDMADKMGVSVGVVNYCLRELARKGLIKINRFKSAKDKIPYTYALTPRGIEERSRITVNFLKSKIREYEEIKRQISLLSREVEEHGLNDLAQAELDRAAASIEG